MRRAWRANSPSNLVPKTTCNFVSFIVLTMENDNDSDDDSSLEEMRSRCCQHATRKFFDGSLSLFFNEGDDEQEEEEQQSYEDPSPRTREIKWFHERLDWGLHL
jgi:hypothetical protein